MNTDLRRVK